METAGATRAPELLERERELGAIEERVDDAVEGRGSVLVVEGPAGIGKTALLDAARPLAGAVGAQFLQARGGELEQSLSFGVVRQLLERRLASTSEEERVQLFSGAAGLAAPAFGSNLTGGETVDTTDASGGIQHGLYWLVANLSDHAPLVIAIDDLHWADPPSVSWLLYLARRLADLPLVVIAATRRVDDGELVPLLAALATEPVTSVVEPSVLSEAASAELVRARLGQGASERFADTCRRASGGNPFLLSELMESVARDRIAPTDESVARIEELAPEAVSRSVLLRIAAMPEGSDDLVRAVTILGGNTDLQTAGSLARLEPEAAAVAADALVAGAILTTEGGLGFTHPLLRSTVYEHVPQGERGLAHRHAAELLDTFGAGAEEVAAHLLRAEPAARESDVETLRRAADLARARGAPPAAVAYLRRALAEGVPGRRSDLMVELTRAAWRALDLAAFDGISEDPVAEIESDPASLVRATPDLGAWLFAGGRIEESRALSDRAIEAEREAGHHETALEHEIGLLAVFDVQPQEALSRLERYAGAVDPGTPAERLWLGMRAWWLHFEGGRAEEVADLAERALAGGAFITELPDLPAPGQAILVLLRADALDGAERMIDVIDEDARRRGSLGAHAMASGVRGQLAQRRGEVTGAVEEARTSVTASRELGIAAVIPLMTAWLVDALVEADRLDEADAELVASGVAGELIPHYWFTPVWLSRARLREAQGRPDEAIDDLRAILARPRPGEYPADSMLALLLAARGESEEASRLAAAGLKRAEAWGTPSAIGIAMRARGLLADAEERIEILREACRTLEASPNRLEHARALLDLGAALRRANRRSEARDQLARAAELAYRGGAAAVERQAREELAATGAKPRRLMLSGVESLTPSELRIARMAAQGMENREIAQALFVTVKTVETHLTSVYRKLDIGSRRELPQALDD